MIETSENDKKPSFGPDFGPQIFFQEFYLC